MAKHGSEDAHDGDEVMLLLLDPNGTVLAVNSCWTTTLGYSEADSVGKPANRFVDSAYAAPLAAHLANLADTTASKFLHVILRTSSGERVGALLSARILTTETNGDIGCEILTLDSMGRTMEHVRRQAARDRAEAAVMRTISAVTDILARTRSTPDFLRDLGLLLEATAGDGRAYIEFLSRPVPWGKALRAALRTRAGTAATSGGVILDHADLVAIAPQLGEAFDGHPAIALWLADDSAPGGRRHLIAALEPNRMLEEAWAQHVGTFADALGSALSCLNTWDQQATLLLKAYTQSVTDPLTRIFNRYKLEETLAAEEQRACRYETGFSVIIADIDNFKAVNDSFGHPTGDVVLEEIAAALRANTRTTDVLGRWGGEEFMIICVHTRLEIAVGLAELLKQRIAQHRFADIGNLTVSFGVAAFESGDTAAAVVARADAALYAAKRSGRNRVCELLRDPPTTASEITAAEPRPEPT